jgi:hypothetical protein
LTNQVTTVHILRRIIPLWPLIAFALLAIGYGAAAIQGRLTWVFYGPVLVAGGMCTGGFTAWVAPWLRIIWRSAVGKFVFTWLHGIVLAVTLIWAQALVAQVLELPPQDFEITVGVCAAVLWPVIWVYIILVPMAVLSLLLLIFFGGAVLLHTLLTSGIWELLSAFLEPTFPAEASRLRRWVEHGRSTSAALAWNSVWRGLGGFMLLFAAAVAQEQYPHAVPYLTSIVRGIAYMADYQPLPKHPGVDGTRRARVHENGVVSYAEDHGKDIHITVDAVRSEPSSHRTEGVEK